MKETQADPRRPYRRPTAGWWRRNPFFVRYMVREATALAVALYALVLLAGLLCLANGEPAYNAWLAVLRHPLSVVLHVALLAAMVYHTWSWFDIMPKTMPPMYLRGKRLPGYLITKAGIAAAMAVTLLILIAVGTLTS